METKTEEKESKYLYSIQRKLSDLYDYKKELFNIINFYQLKDDNFIFQELHLTLSEIYLLKSIIKEVEE